MCIMLMVVDDSSHGTICRDELCKHSTSIRRMNDSPDQHDLSEVVLLVVSSTLPFFLMAS